VGPHLAAGFAGRARPESSQRPGAAAAAGATTRSPIAGSGVKDCTGGGFLVLFKNMNRILMDID